MYILGTKVNIFTDHKALTFLNKCIFLSERFIRYAFKIQRYNIEINHITGTKNFPSDLLSSLLQTEETKIHKKHEALIASILAAKPSQSLIENLKNIKQLQRKDESTKKNNRQNHQWQIQIVFNAKRNNI